MIQHSRIQIKCVLSNYQDSTAPLLSTVLVYIDLNYYKRHEVRALLDSGSQSNFITEELVNKLGLSTSNIDMTINVINGQFSSLKHKYDANINSRINKFSTLMTCFVVP